jgi:hypothetical protein
MNSLGMKKICTKREPRYQSGVQKLVGMTGLASLILCYLFLTQEAPSRLRRDRFVFSFALENKFSALLKIQNPQLRCGLLVGRPGRTILEPVCN